MHKKQILSEEEEAVKGEKNLRCNSAEIEEEYESTVVY